MVEETDKGEGKMNKIEKLSERLETLSERLKTLEDKPEFSEILFEGCIIAFWIACIILFLLGVGFILGGIF